MINQRNASLQRIAALIKKEIMQSVRDWQMLSILIIVPAASVLLYGYAFNMNPREIPIVVEDALASKASREIIMRLDVGEDFEIAEVRRMVEDPIELFKDTRAKALIKLPSDLVMAGSRPGPWPHIRVIIDGSDQNVAHYISNVIGPALIAIVTKNGLRTKVPPLEVQTHILFNPKQNSQSFLIPGLIGTLLNMVAVLMTCLSITKEKMKNTMAMLYASPLKGWEIIAGKLLPLIVMVAGVAVISLISSQLFFGVGIRGGVMVFIIATFFYIVAALSLGLVFSIAAHNQQQAMMMTVGITMMPAMVLSGFVFPLESMPAALQLISKIIPATHYITIVRGVMLKGVGLSVLWPQLFALVLLSGTFVFFAIRKCRVMQ